MSRLLRRVGQLAEKKAAITEALDSAIVEAARGGASYRQIAAVSGLSHVQVGRIVKAAEPPARPPDVAAMSEEDVLRAMREAIAKPSEFRPEWRA